VSNAPHRPIDAEQRSWSTGSVRVATAGLIALTLIGVLASGFIRIHTCDGGHRR
jgi:hypothetical protein